MSTPATTYRVWFREGQNPDHGAAYLPLIESQEFEMRDIVGDSPEDATNCAIFQIVSKPNAANSLERLFDTDSAVVHYYDVAEQEA